MEFQRERVYTALNADELKQGDKVIVDYDIAHLKEQVKLGVFYLPIKKINAEDITCRFNVGDGNDYPLAYLVERKENCTNCGSTCGYADENHHALQCSRCDNWQPKAEPKTEQKAEKHYRPFKDTDELIKVWQRKCGDVAVRLHKLDAPYIWVRYKAHPENNYLITGLFGENDEVFIGQYSYKLSEFFRDWEFLDGSPCGVEE